MAHASGSNPYTAQLASYVASTRLEDVPSEVVHRLKLLILDSLGCGLFGADLPWVRILKTTLQSLDRTTDGPACWGSSLRLSAPHAVLVNGTQIQGFELDDVHRHGVLHVGAVTLPGLLAIAARGGLSGPDFLAAALAGYETGPRVGICMGQEHIGQGWHSGATVGVFASGAACARALRLDADQTVHALGIAGTQAAGLMAAQYGAMVKRMHAGRSAQSGFYGAELAKNGFTGITDVFESEYGGFCTTFSRSQDRFQLEALTQGLGSTYETMRIALKFYSCVGSNHTTLDAIQDIKKRHPFEISDLQKIRVFGSQVTADHVGWPYKPEGLTSAQLNLPFCVATLLLEGDVFVHQFPESCVHDQQRIQVSQLVEVQEDPAITALGSKFRHKVRVEIEFKDGSKEVETREAPRGSELFFASDDDIRAKFRKLGLCTFDQERLTQIAETVMNLEQLKDARVLVSLLEKAD
jgi:aconitate decarboxylase